MDKLLKQFETKSVNLSDLTPRHVNRDANIKLLKKLDERNKARQQRLPYKYNDVLAHLKVRTTRQLDNPKAYAVDGNSNPENQKMELIRMAKITAKKAMEGGSTMSEYLDKKEKFMTTYSKKINEFRMIPMIDDIFEKFKDINYKEKGYDTDYLGQGASDNYLKSLQSKAESKKLIGKLEQLETSRSTDNGQLQQLLTNMDQNQSIASGDIYNAIGHSGRNLDQLLRELDEKRTTDWGSLQDLLKSQQQFMIEDADKKDRQEMEVENKKKIKQFKKEAQEKRRKREEEAPKEEEGSGSGGGVVDAGIDVPDNSLVEQAQQEIRELLESYTTDKKSFDGMTSRQIGEAVAKLPKRPFGQGTTTPFKYYVKQVYDMFYDKEKNTKAKDDIKKAMQILNPSNDASVKLPDQKVILKVAQIRYQTYRRSADEKLIEGATTAQAKMNKKAQDKKKM
jgi:hypothetical protein